MDDKELIFWTVVLKKIADLQNFFYWINLPIWKICKLYSRKMSRWTLWNKNICIGQPNFLQTMNAKMLKFNLNFYNYKENMWRSNYLILRIIFNIACYYKICFVVRFLKSYILIWSQPLFFLDFTSSIFIPY